MRPSKNTLYIIIILSVCAAFFFLGLGERGLWSPDETRYIAVSKEIQYSGDWFTLRRNGQIYSQKPPVFFWFISLSAVIFGGFSEFVARSPSALAGAGGVFITYLFARQLFNEKVGLYSSIILSTSLAYLAASRYVILDTTLTFFVLSAIYLMYVGLTKQERRRQAYPIAFVFMALATLTKGPVGFILPLLTMITYALFTKNSRSLFTKDFFIGLISAILIIAAWLIPACLAGGESYTKDLLLKQIFGRFFNAFDHKEPFYFYLIRFPLEFLPWAIFIPAAAILLKKRAGESSVKFILIWFTVIFLFFCVSKSKNDLYILPAYPAASIAIACYLESKTNKGAFIFGAILTFMLILNTTLTYVILPRFDIYKSPKYAAQKFIKHTNAGSPLMTFNENPVYWLYYCERRQMDELKNYEELEAYLKTKTKVFCIIGYDDYEKFKRSSKVETYLIESAPWGIRGRLKDPGPKLRQKETLMLISNEKG